MDGGCGGWVANTNTPPSLALAGDGDGARTQEQSLSTRERPFNGPCNSEEGLPLSLPVIFV